MVPEVVPADQNFLAWQLAKNLAVGHRGTCQYQSGLQRDFGLAAIAMAGRATPPRQPPTNPRTIRTTPTRRSPSPKTELPEEFIGQAIKEIVMHEVGHSLGLRHNFKASTMLTADQLNDTTITHAKGLVGSVMDYSPINIAPKGKKQGDYYTTTLGPYDYWAIEYAYKVVDGDEAAELKKIASRAPEHDLVYATDEDSFLNDDPYVNRWDLGSDPCQFGKERIALATELLKDLDARVVKDGESWARTRRAFSMLLEQWGDGATLASQYIGGQSVSRDHKADKDARDPIVPVPGPSSASASSSSPTRSSPTSRSSFHRPCSAGWEPSAGRTGARKAASSGRASISRCSSAFWESRRSYWAIALSSSTLARLENQQLQADPDADPLADGRGVPLIDRRDLVRP